MFLTSTSQKTRLGEGSGLLSGLSGIAFCSIGIILGVGRCEAQGVEPGSGGKSQQKEPSMMVTNVAQFRSVPREVFLGRCAFQLDGLVTLVDPDRDLMVLEDETGGVALNPRAGVRDMSIQVGQRVSLAGSRCSPYVVGFPGYPYQPSGWEVRPSFATR
jgi:hypothetical protein